MAENSRRVDLRLQGRSVLIADCIHIARLGMRQQLVAFHIYDLLLRRQPVWERGVRLDRGQMGQEDSVLRHTLPRGDILDCHQLQSQLRHLHGAEDRERSLFSSHLSDPLHTRYGIHAYPLVHVDHEQHSLSFLPVLPTVLSRIFCFQPWS